MVTTMRVLKRKDGSSLVVGVVLGIFISTFVGGFTRALAASISGVSSSLGLRNDYLLPAVWFVLELIALEILIWLWCWASAQMKSKPQA